MEMTIIILIAIIIYLILTIFTISRKTFYTQRGFAMIINKLIKSIIISKIMEKDEEMKRKINRIESVVEEWKEKYKFSDEEGIRDFDFLKKGDVKIWILLRL